MHGRHIASRVLGLFLKHCLRLLNVYDSSNTAFSSSRSVFSTFRRSTISTCVVIYLRNFENENQAKETKKGRTSSIDIFVIFCVYLTRDFDSSIYRYLYLMSESRSWDGPQCNTSNNDIPLNDARVRAVLPNVATNAISRRALQNSGISVRYFLRNFMYSPFGQSENARAASQKHVPLSNSLFTNATCVVH